ncbi:MAG TPA: hypothetical protein VKS19_12145, partial [Verrucomicrobiae bacterium]|nr:hypothetical protein [Verrucomicrobiae bacterium]
QPQPVTEHRTLQKPGHQVDDGAIVHGHLSANGLKPVTVARTALRMPMAIKSRPGRRAGFVSFKGSNSTIHMGSFSRTCAARRQYLPSQIAENPESEALLPGGPTMQALMLAYPKSDIGLLHYQKSSITTFNSRLWCRQKNTAPGGNGVCPGLTALGRVDFSSLVHDCRRVQKLIPPARKQSRNGT